MATSDSTDFEPNVAEFVEEAFERCGLELRTGYDLKTAKRSINLMLAEWANRGLNQWTVEQATQTVTESQNDYTLTSNVIDILDCSIRRTTNGTELDLQMSRVSRSEYLNIPTKSTKSRPSQFFLDKLNPEIYNLTKSTFKKRIINLFGVKTNEKLVPVSEETEILKINGFIFKPEFAKKTRGEQYFFVNNRFIKSPYLNHAINSAFEGLIDVKHNPSYFLNLEVDAATIDINIHPTKTEIKFEDEHSIYAILRAAVKHSIGQYSISPVLDFQRDKSLDVPYNFSKNKGNSSVGIDVDTNYNPFEHPGKNKSFVKIDSFEKEMQSLEFSSDSNNLSKIDFKELTKNISVESTIQIDKKYIINKNKSSLIIVNQQRAHQRILYEKFLQSITLNNYGAQKLLHPIDFDFSTEEISVLNSNKKILNQFGLIFNCGKDQLTITSMPAYVEVENLKDSIDNLIFNLNHEIPDNSFSEADLISKIMAKSLSIKNGTILDVKEQQYIINALFACKESLISPFNKKTYVKIEYSQIDNMFK